MNPALAARCFMLISFAQAMTKFTDPVTDAVASATPLAAIKAGDTYDLAAMFIGKIPGTIGEVSVIALLIGAAYLLVKKVITIRIPQHTSFPSQYSHLSSASTILTTCSQRFAAAD